MENETSHHDAEEVLAALLRDLSELSAYLRERGQRTYELAQRFMENAQRNPASRAYDERQATMLEYQHYIWIEIAGRVDKLLVTYGGDGDDGETAGGTDGAPADGAQGEQASE